MTKNTTAKSRPTHRAYAVARDKEKAKWVEIGAAWAHQDGKGFSVSLAAYPANGAELVLRVVAEPAPAPETETA